MARWSVRDSCVTAVHNLLRGFDQPTGTVPNTAAYRFTAQRRAAFRIGLITLCLKVTDMFRSGVP